MAIFNSYAKLPEVKIINKMKFFWNFKNSDDVTIRVSDFWKVPQEVAWQPQRPIRNVA